MLTVGSSGVVDGQIEGLDVYIEGRFLGHVQTEHIKIGGKSHLIGDICTRMLEIVEGAVFRGNCRMMGEEQETPDLRKLPTDRPAASD